MASDPPNLHVCECDGACVRIDYSDGSERALPKEIIKPEITFEDDGNKKSITLRIAKDRARQHWLKTIGNYVVHEGKVNWRGKYFVRFLP